MNHFRKRLPSFRLVNTNYGDDLQGVAAREMGDANRWVELVWLNALVPPYITDDPRRLAPGVVLSGSLIKAPSATNVWTDAAEYGQVFERDCALVGKVLLADEGGDLQVLAGADNLRQQLQHRIVTPMGQARRHPEYGCMVWRLIGRINGPLATAMGAQYVQAALAADYRVSRVNSSAAIMRTDSVVITAKLETIEGGAIDLAVAPADPAP